MKRRYPAPARSAPFADDQLALGEWAEPTAVRDDPPGELVPDVPYELASLAELRPPSVAVAALRTLDWTFATDDTTYLSHDLHPYAAKFVPQIPAALIAALSLRGETVWDPFGGSGTTALEAALRYRHALSTDANPLCEVIGRAKTATLTPEDGAALLRLRDQVLILGRSHKPLMELTDAQRAEVQRCIPAIPRLDKWFDPRAVADLALIKWLLTPLENGAASVATAIFSKIIVRASNQDSETRYSCKPHPVLPGEVLRLYASELTVATKRVSRMSTYLQFRRPHFGTLDLRWPVVAADGLVTPESVSLVVTSPPYPNAMDYHLYHRFRLYWLGYDPTALGRIEIGSHLRHQREANGIETYLNEMRGALDNVLTALQPGRLAVFVVGDAVYEARLYSTHDLLLEVAADLGFEHIETLGRSLPAHRRSFIPGARRAQGEQVLILRRPPRPLRVTCLQLPYRPWPYELTMRRAEVEAVTGSTVAGADDDALSVVVDAYEVDRLSRLVFTHAASIDDRWTLRTWQAWLENGLAEGTRKEPKYVTHGVHPYKGKFYPQLAKALFNVGGLNPGMRVLDPFCGSGTVVLEAKLSGLGGLGLDINPLSVLIARAKAEILDVDPLVVDRVLGKLLVELEAAESRGRVGAIDTFDAATHDELVSWFPPVIIPKLALCMSEVDRIPNQRTRDFARVLLSSIVRDVSLQEPRDLRIRRRAVPLHDAPVYALFASRVEEARRRLRAFASVLDRCPWPLRPGAVALGDVRLPETLANLCGGPVDAIVTSPPYATALPYVDTYRLNMLVVMGLGSDARRQIEDATVGTREISDRRRRELEFAIEGSDAVSYHSALADEVTQRILAENRAGLVGFRRRNMAALVHRYFSDMLQALKSIDSVLRSGSPAFFVLGDNVTTTALGPVPVTTTAVLAEIAASLGWQMVRSLPITVTRENYRHAKNAIAVNTVLHFVKD